MAKEVPRRLRRFQRAGKSSRGFSSPDIVENIIEQIPKKQGNEEKAQDITMHLTLQEVRKFKQEHKRYPKRDEYDQIAESIYQQLKDKEKIKRIFKHLERQKAREKPTEKRKCLRERGKEFSGPAGQPPTEGEPVLKKGDLEELGVADLFANEKDTGIKKGAEKQIAEEFDLSGLGDEKAKEEESGCPNCSAANQKIVFCPECGTAFCANCAKKVEKIAGRTILVCPSCGKKVNQ